MQKKDLQIGVRVSEDMLRALRKLASDDRRSLSDYVRLLLEEHIASKQGKHGKRTG